MCSRLIALGFDIFDKKLLTQSVLGIADIDADKLQNILTCEKKRLKRFAVEYSYEQHLLNLQSLLITLLDDLIKKLADPATSLEAFQHTLLRMIVLIQELDNLVAKAKSKKRLDWDAANIIIRLEEERLKIAADKSKDEAKKEFHPIPKNDHDYTDLLALLAQLEKEFNLMIEGYTKQACLQLHQYQLHKQRCRILPIDKFNIKQELQQIIQRMELDPNLQHSVLAESLRQSYLSPFRTKLR